LDQPESHAHLQPITCRTEWCWLLGSQGPSMEREMYPYPNSWSETGRNETQTQPKAYYRGMTLTVPLKTAEGSSHQALPWLSFKLHSSFGLKSSHSTKTKYTLIIIISF
jgi:hypothetical protein